MQQQVEDEDDFLIPLNVNTRLSPFIDRYFIKSYTENHHYVYMHSNKLYMVGITTRHPIVTTPSEIEDISFAPLGNINNINELVKGKKKRGGIKVKQGSVLANVTLANGNKHQIFSNVDGFIIEVNENLAKDKSYLKTNPQDKGFVVIIQGLKKHQSKLLTYDEYSLI